jgi:hypothetical protein
MSIRMYDKPCIWMLTYSSCCCFFVRLCSNIGRLARSIRNRRHPAKNILNQYMRGVFAHTSSRPLLDEDEEEDHAAAMGVGEDAKHPLTPLGSVSSFTTVNHISWPKLNRWTGKQPYKTVDLHNLRARVIQPTLGDAVCHRNQRKGYQGFSFVTTTKTVQAGMWQYSCTASEDNWVERVTLSSWFCIQLQHIPHALDSADMRLLRDNEPTRLAYGRFRHFAELRLPDWSKDDSLHYLGHCTLYMPAVYSAAARLESIDITQPLVLQLEGKQSTTGYINLKHIKTQVAVGPAIDTTQRPLARIPGQFVVMPLQK